MYAIMPGIRLKFPHRSTVREVFYVTDFIAIYALYLFSHFKNLIGGLDAPDTVYYTHINVIHVLGYTF